MISGIKVYTELAYFYIIHFFYIYVRKNTTINVFQLCYFIVTYNFFYIIATRMTINIVTYLNF